MGSMMGSVHIKTDAEISAVYEEKEENLFICRILERTRKCSTPPFAKEDDEDDVKCFRSKFFYSRRRPWAAVFHNQRRYFLLGIRRPSSRKAKDNSLSSTPFPLKDRALREINVGTSFNNYSAMVTIPGTVEEPDVNNVLSRIRSEHINSNIIGIQADRMSGRE